MRAAMEFEILNTLDVSFTAANGEVQFIECKLTQGGDRPQRTRPARSSRRFSRRVAFYAACCRNRFDSTAERRL